jgi:NTP pyrophosphatase (non-canonical NTP hydrolase)
MELITYRNLIDAFDLYPADQALECYTLGLSSEAGEVAGKVKKILRGDDVKKQDIMHELGDVLWYIDRLAMYFGLQIEELAEMNYRKLLDRQTKGTLRGNGDNR